MGTLFTIYKHFGDFVKWIFTILLQIQHENNYLPTSKDRQANFVPFLIFACATASFFAQISSPKSVLKRDAILAPVSKDIPSYGS